MLLSASQVRRSNLQDELSLLLLLLLRVLLMLGLLQSSVKDLYGGGGIVVMNDFSARYFSM